MNQPSRRRILLAKLIGEYAAAVATDESELAQKVHAQLDLYAYGLDAGEMQLYAMQAEIKFLQGRIDHLRRLQRMRPQKVGSVRISGS